MMRLMVILLLSLQLWAGAEHTPKLFEQMGDPLYAFAQKAQVLKNDTVVGRDMASYIADANAVRKTGLAAQNEKNGEATTLYLQQLRGLKKQFDHLMLGMKRELLESIQHSDVKRFVQLMSTEPQVADMDPSLRKEIAGFYTAKRLKGRSAFLDRVVKKEKDLDTAYVVETSTEEYEPMSGGTAMHKQVTLIGTATCPYCIKARKFMREQGIPFRDLDVKSPQGQRLYKQNNGKGVPLILIGENRISGYNPQAILRAYEQ